MSFHIAISAWIEYRLQVQIDEFRDNMKSALLLQAPRIMGQVELISVMNLRLL